MPKPLYIFDLDGTLALVDHRRHFVEKATFTAKDGTVSDVVADWDSFYAACVNNEPNEPVIGILKVLAEYADIWIFSGRGDAVRAETEVWLGDHSVFYSNLAMRKAGDFTPDTKLKQSWFYAMSPEDRERLVAVFDDRDSVVAMWRRNGVTCLQVAPGDF